MVSPRKKAGEAVRKQDVEDENGKKKKKRTRTGSKNEGEEGTTEKGKLRKNSSTKVVHFKVFRENEHDQYKQNAPSVLTKLTQLPLRPSRALTPDDVSLFETIGSDMDRSMYLEEIIFPHGSSSSSASAKRPSLDIADEVRQEINRLPSWLQSMVTHKYPLIHAQYKEDTAKFFRAIGNRIEKRYGAKLRSLTSTIEDEPSEVKERDPENMDTVQLDYYKLNEDDLNVSRGKKYETESAIAFRVAHAAEQWKRETFDKNKKIQVATAAAQEDPLWEPKHISRANLKLRTALQTRATYRDIMTVAKDAEMLRVDPEVDQDKENFILKPNRADYWYNVFDKKYTIRATELAVEKKLTQIRKVRSKTMTTKKQQNQKGGDKGTKKMDKNNTNRGGPGRPRRHHLRRRIFVTKHGKRRRKRILLTRGYFRDHSRLFNTNCGRYSQTPSRHTRSYRVDGSFHQYCAALVSGFWFKIIVMIVIGLNAIVLALETYSMGEDHAFFFEIIDNIFVGIYTVECVLKIYAHPYTYWRSGFNIFDFVILLASIIKNISDWTNTGEMDVLRVFLIVRALRILRGISLSVQLQVLLSALIETIHSHVLSVVLLLVLLLYVASIIAFYLFGGQYPAAFGTVGYGMLNMLRVLTIDGWTDLNAALYERAGVPGTLFMISCIILGNFLFSNIFVAIIIMNISEATDNFREKQREQRETIVRLKKEKVFQRQKLDLRQLLYRQRPSAYTDFFSLGQQFEKLLRHDDLLAMKEIITSPLWMDSVYQTIRRAHHTSSVLMNLHREMADNLLDIYRLNKESKMTYAPIRRARYNRYLRMKAKLALIKQEILKDRLARQPKTKINFS